MGQSVGAELLRPELIEAFAECTGYKCVVPLICVDLRTTWSSARIRNPGILVVPWDSSGQDPISLFDVRKRKYVPMPESPLRRVGCAYAMANGCLYVLGGFRSDTQENLDTVEIFDLRTRTWSTGIPMPSPLASLRAVEAGGSLYTFPVSRAPEGVRVDRIQKFDIATSTWSELSITTDPDDADLFDEDRVNFLSVQHVAKISDNRVFVMFEHDVVGDDWDENDGEMPDDENDWENGIVEKLYAILDAKDLTYSALYEMPAVRGDYTSVIGSGSGQKVFALCLSDENFQLHTLSIDTMLWEQTDLTIILGMAKQEYLLRGSTFHFWDTCARQGLAELEGDILIFGGIPGIYSQEFDAEVEHMTTQESTLVFELNSPSFDSANILPPMPNGHGCHCCCTFMLDDIP